MRSLKVTTILFAAALVLAPRPAFAWWDLLDYLSGPGPFQGIGVQVRLLCAGKEVGFDDLKKKVSNAAMETVTKGHADSAKAGWQSVLEKLDSMNEDIQILDRKEIAGLLTVLGNTKQEAFDKVADQVLGPAVDKSTGKMIPLPPNDPMRTSLFDPIHRLLDRFYAGYLRIVSSGTDLTLCTTKRERTFALEFSAVTEWAKGEPNYAGGNSIQLTTATVDVTYRFSLPAVGDVADVGAGGGMYFFSSSGFSTFSGLTLEQYVQLHGPSRWANASCFKQFLGRLSLRVGLVEFPAGLDTNQFGAVGANIRHIPGHEVVPQATVLFHFNLTAPFKKDQLRKSDWQGLQ